MLLFEEYRPEMSRQEFNKVYEEEQVPNVKKLLAKNPHIRILWWADVSDVPGVYLMAILEIDDEYLEEVKSDVEETGVGPWARAHNSYMGPMRSRMMPQAA